MKSKFLRKAINSKFSLSIRFAVFAVKQINILFWVLFFVSVIGVCNYEAGWLKLRTVTPFTTAINSILNQIGIAYITGIIFYFFIEVLKVARRKVAIFRLINNHIISISNGFGYIVGSVCERAVSAPPGTEYSDKDFSKFWNDVDPKTFLIYDPFNPRKNLDEYLTIVLDETEKKLDLLNGYNDLLDENWALRMANVTDCVLLIRVWLKTGAKGMLVSSSIWTAYYECKELKKLAKKMCVQTNMLYGRHSHWDKKYTVGTMQ